MTERTRRRRRGGDSLIAIYWRDIPAQVTASAGGETHKALLDARFQHAIDRAAAVAGLTETKAYVNEWRRVRHPLDGDAAAAVEALAARLDADHPRDRLEALVAAGGLDPDASGSPSHSPTPEDDHP